MKDTVLLCTGGIGSGKSFVIGLFNALDIPSYDCDLAAKRLYDEDPELLDGVRRLAGDSVVGADGRLDRRALAAKIFADRELLAGVEALVHPAVMRHFGRWRESQASPLVVLESAILLEKPALASMFDLSLVVTAPEEVRVARVMERDSMSREQVMSRMGSQWSDEKRLAAADFVIVNDGVRPLLPEVVRIMDILENGSR